MVSFIFFILVDPDRFELPLRANLALTGYKPAFLPLEDGSTLVCSAGLEPALS